jgi:hypothetical protein
MCVSLDHFSFSILSALLGHEILEVVDSSKWWTTSLRQLSTQGTPPYLIRQMTYIVEVDKEVMSTEAQSALLLVIKVVHDNAIKVVATIQPR